MLPASEFQTGGSGRRKRVSARHQVKLSGRGFRQGSLWRKQARRKKEVFFIGADPKLRNFTGACRRLGFGPDVFADALVPCRRIVARRSIPPKTCSRPITASAGTRCGDGYRFAKRQGESNSAGRPVIQQNKRFCDFGGGTEPMPFRFDSSRCLNCSSNLIGHDPPNKPANGDGK